MYVYNVCVYASVRHADTRYMVTRYRTIRDDTRRLWASTNSQEEHRLADLSGDPCGVEIEQF